MNFNYCELKKKCVINVNDGKDLGKIIDFTIDFPSGKVHSITVPGKKGGFMSKGELIIGFGCIEKIGNDAILVRLCEGGRPGGPSMGGPSMGGPAVGGPAMGGPAPTRPTYSPSETGFSDDYGE